FFQAEDGIRDRNVTGVQTCALPILRLNWEAETPMFSASSFCVMWFPLHKSEIRCPGVPGKAIDTHLLRILPLYRMIAKMQFPKCKLHQNAILAKFRGLHFFRVDLG